VRIESFRIVNYKSFADSGEVRFQPGFNVIVGRNNVGKTALAEAVGLRFSDKPHRSLMTVPTPGAQPDAKSQVEVSASLEAGELAGLLAVEMPIFYVPDHSSSPQAGEGWLASALSEGTTLKAIFHQGGPISARLSTYGESTVFNRYLQYSVDSSGTPVLVGEAGGSIPSDYPELAIGLASRFLERLYSFSAVRFGIDENPIGTNRTLAPNASDLVQVLDLLNRNTSRWQRYFERVRAVLPEVEAITFVPSEQGGGHVRAQLWNIDPDTEREDLAVPLSESGTGVGRVLAILYVVFTTEYPRTIVIDEPQSFLHPGAVRKLFEILKDYPQHQYVITTHSPNAVTAADPSALLLVRKEGEQSVIEEIDAATVRQQGRFLREVGATLSDVFGADNILWVEGATEEECFPIIITKLLNRQLLGTKVVGVVHTSDFERKYARTALSIYLGLSEVKGILPPTKGFIFDREKRPDKERDELETRSGGKATLTNRRMYENYLLNPCAIAHVISQTGGFREGEEVSTEKVEEWIEEYGWEDKYFDAQMEEPARKDHLWLIEVDGAKLLEDMFSSLSETRVTYDKVAHGAMLTRWVCDNAPEDLEEFARLIEERLDGRE
jgi:predicted ATPase